MAIFASILSMWEETSPGLCPVCRQSAASEPKIALRRDGLPVRRCSVCGTLFVDPRPSETSLLNFYTDERNIQMGPGFLERLSNEVSQGNYKCLGALPAPQAAKRRLLDVGCAAGFAMSAAQKAGWEVYGAELSPDLAEIGRLRLGLTIFSGSQNDIGAQLETVGKFDVITMLDVIEHVDDIGSLIKFYAQYLEQDGIILLDTPNIPQRAIKYKADLQKIESIHFQEILEHLSYLSIDSLLWLCPQLGLHIETWGTYGARWIDYQPRMRSRRSIRLFLEKFPLFSTVYWRIKRPQLSHGEVLHTNNDDHIHLYAVLRRQISVPSPL